MKFFLRTALREFFSWFSPSKRMVIGQSTTLRPLTGGKPWSRPAFSLQDQMHLTVMQQAQMQALMEMRTQSQSQALFQTQIQMQQQAMNQNPYSKWLGGIGGGFFK